MAGTIQNSNLQKTIRILDSQQDKFNRKLISLNKRLAKYGSQISLINKTSGYQQFTLLVNDKVIPAYRKINELTFELPEVQGKENVKFLGNYSIRSGVPQVYSVDNAIPLNQVFDASGKCDHCSHNRKRTTWAFFEEDGEIKQIGSTCVMDYYGFPINEIMNSMDVTFISYLEAVEDTQVIASGDDEDLIFKRMAAEWSYFSLKDYLPHLMRATNNFKNFWKKSPEGTTQTAMRSFFSKSLQKLSEEEYQEIENMIKDRWPYNPNSNSDFAFNILSNLWTSDGQFIDKYSLENIGIVSWAIWESVFKSLEKAKNKKSHIANAHIGNIKDKIEISGFIKRENSIDTVYGFLDIYSIRTSEGLLKWFTSSPVDINLHHLQPDKYSSLTGWMDELRENKGVKVKIRATIKGHSEYNNMKETIVKNVKILEIEE